MMVRSDLLFLFWFFIIVPFVAAGSPAVLLKKFSRKTFKISYDKQVSIAHNTVAVKNRSK